jgi:hypothetical protein
MLVGDVDLHWKVSVVCCHVCRTIGIELKVTKSCCHCPQGVMLSVELGAYDSLALVTLSQTSMYTFSVKLLFVT